MKLKRIGGSLLIAVTAVAAGCTNELWRSKIALPLEKGSVDLEADVRAFYTVVDDVCGQHSLSRTTMPSLEEVVIYRRGEPKPDPLLTHNPPRLLYEGKSIYVSLRVDRFEPFSGVKLEIGFVKGKLRWPAEARYLRFREEMKQALLQVFDCDRLDVWDKKRDDPWSCEPDA